MSLKTSIGWTDMTLNPIKGLCQGGCWFCYYSGKRGIAHRFKQDPELRLDLSVFDRLPKAPKKVFLCSTNDYWGGWIPDEWREAIRQKTQEYPQHTFQVLTKQYRNLRKDGPYPENWWIGETITDGDDDKTPLAYFDIEAKIKFISFEPLLNWWDSATSEMVAKSLKIAGIKWVIIGRLTGYGHRYDPKIVWVEEIVRACDKAGVKVFLKDNLEPLLVKQRDGQKYAPLWANGGYGTLRQEMPV